TFIAEKDGVKYIVSSDKIQATYDLRGYNSHDIYGIYVSHLLEDEMKADHFLNILPPVYNNKRLKTYIIELQQEFRDWFILKLENNAYEKKTGEMMTADEAMEASTP